MIVVMKSALKDGVQSLTFENFANLISVLEPVTNAVGRQIAKAKAAPGR